jgi:hypothetical protein
MKEGKFVLSDVPTGDMLEELFGRFAALVGEQIRNGNVSGVVDQSESPLGPHRHCAAVRRRIAQKEGGANRLGKKYLLTQAALQEELMAGKPASPGAKGRPHSAEVSAPGSLKDNLREQLRRVR